jgi:hypothetical protein
MTARGRYEAVARALLGCKPLAEEPTSRYEFWREIVEAIARELQEDNPALERERFLRECGYS